MSKRTKLAAAGIGCALLVGGGAAFATTKLDSPHAESQAVINDAAKKLGVTPGALSTALKQALKDRIDAAVAAGRLTRAEGDALKQRLDSGFVPFLFGGFHRGGVLDRFGLFTDAATYLGVTEAQLRADLAAGTSLADVAKARGKSVTGLIDALVAAQTKRLDAAVAAGKLTKADEQSVLAGLKQRITTFVNETGRADGPLGLGFRFRFRGDLDHLRAPPMWG
jgi:hypothetical protein